jgi:hypothetical protein
LLFTFLALLPLKTLVFLRISCIIARNIRFRILLLLFFSGISRIFFILVVFARILGGFAPLVWPLAYFGAKLQIRVIVIEYLRLVKERQVDGREWRYHVLLAVTFSDELVVSLCQFADFQLRRVLGRGQEVRLVVRVELQVFNLLLAIEHLPALDAQNLAI